MFGGGEAGGDRDDLLAAIRSGAGGGLKKASDRVMPEKDNPGDTQSAMLAEIRAGRHLKKVVVQKAAPKQEQQVGGLNIAAILNRRAALADDSETDDDDDDDEWND